MEANVPHMNSLHFVKGLSLWIGLGGTRDHHLRSGPQDAEFGITVLAQVGS